MDGLKTKIFKVLLLFGIAIVGLLLIIVTSIPLSRYLIPRDLPAVLNDRTLAIDNVHLIVFDGDELLMDRQVILSGGIIESILPAGTPVDPEIRLIDGRYGYLVPGLFDMHAHIWDRKHQVLSLTHGVTSVRNMSGQPVHLRWRSELQNKKWLGSNLYTSTPTLNGSEYYQFEAQKLVDDIQTARKLVQRYKKEGWDFIKIYVGLELDVYKTIIEEAEQAGIMVAGHVPHSVVEYDYRLAASMASIEHVEDIFYGPLGYSFDEERLVDVAKMLKEMGSTVTPTLTIFDHLVQIALHGQEFVDQQPLEYLNPLYRFVMDRTSGARWLSVTDAELEWNRRIYDHLPKIVRVLHEHGVPLTAGSDYGYLYTIPGLATHRELELLVEAGLSPLEALKAATINSANVLGVGDKTGSIEIGKTADLILVHQNPLIDIRALQSPIAVIKEGQWLSNDDLQSMKASASNPSNIYLSLGRFLEFVLTK